MRYYIISGFPGIGKSYAYKWLSDYIQNNNLNWIVYDTDSSTYSHITDENGLRHINPDFPNNYLNAIEERIKSNADKDKCIIFTSTHDVVRNILNESGYKVTLLYPPVGAKEVYLERYRDRKSPEALIKVIKENFEKWIDEIESENMDNFHKYQLEKYQYLSSVLLYLLNEEGSEYK